MFLGQVVGLHTADIKINYWKEWHHNWWPIERSNELLWGDGVGHSKSRNGQGRQWCLNNTPDWGRPKWPQTVTKRRNRACQSSFGTQKYQFPGQRPTERFWRFCVWFPSSLAIACPRDGAGEKPRTTSQTLSLCVSWCSSLRPATSGDGVANFALELGTLAPALGNLKVIFWVCTNNVVKPNPAHWRCGTRPH